MASPTVPAVFDEPRALSAAATLCDAFQITASENADRVALRTADGSLEITWAQYAERARRIAGGLASLGIGRGDTVALMMTNRPEFNLCDTAAFHLGATPFSIYNTSAPEQIEYLFANAANKVVIVEEQFLDRVLAARDKAGALEHIICVGDLADLEARAPEDFDLREASSVVEPDDVLTLIYTSGTTGPPKGVQTTHANMLAQCRGAAAALPIRPGGRVASFLPSAHIADRWSSHYNALIFGLEITCVPDPRQIVAVLPQVRPTFAGCVPRILEKIKAGLEAGIEREPDERVRQATRWAIDVGRRKVAREWAGEPVPAELAAEYEAADAQVLSRIRERLGLDQADCLIVGAAPTPREVFEFFAGIGLPITEIYGMSEASCVMSGAAPAQARPGTVGPALPGLEVTLAEDGELLCRGAQVMKGYRNDPERTSEAIDADGWLHTGDIAQIDDDGYVKIVDRKKEIIINAAGKNMSPANIEGQLKSASPFIGQACCIGDGRPYNTALIVLDADYLPAWAAQQSIEDTSLETLAADERVRAEVERGVQAANAKLARVEQIKTFTIMRGDWLPGGDELTPTMKLKRKPIAEKYAAEIEALYTR